MWWLVAGIRAPGRTPLARGNTEVGPAAVGGVVRLCRVRERVRVKREKEIVSERNFRERKREERGKRVGWSLGKRE